MINLQKEGESLKVTFTDSDFYLYGEGEMTIPLNSLIMIVEDASDMIVFKKIANRDVLFSGLIENITINGEHVTKETISDKFQGVANASVGMSAYVLEDGETLDPNDPKYQDTNKIYLVKSDDGESYIEYVYVEAIHNHERIGSTDINLDDYYTKEEVNYIQDLYYYTPADEISEALSYKQDVIDDLDQMRQDISAANQVTEAYNQGELVNQWTLEEQLSYKQDTLESGVNIKTINGEDILGEGDITVSGGDEHFKYNPTEEFTDGIVVYKDMSAQMVENTGLYPSGTRFKVTPKPRIQGMYGYDVDLYLKHANDYYSSLRIHIDISSFGSFINFDLHWLNTQKLGKVNVYLDNELFNTLDSSKNSVSLNKNDFDRYTYEVVDCENFYFITSVPTSVSDFKFSLIRIINDGAYLANNGDKKEIALKEDIIDSYTKTESDNKYADKEDVTELSAKVDDLQLYKFPNATIFGTPTINNGQVSNFSNDNYLQFPFLVDFQNRPFNIYFSFTTPNDLSGQQNILDSNYGLAFAIREGSLIAVASDNGTSWTTGELIGGQLQIQGTTTYYVTIYWKDGIFGFKGGTSKDDESFSASVEMANTPFPKTMVIGRSYTNNGNHFGGSINLNDASLEISNKVVWQGMDDVGLATRAAVDLSNIDDKGKEVIKDIVSATFQYDEATKTLTIITE